jgi:hypothetical protein
MDEIKREKKTMALRLKNNDPLKPVKLVVRLA